MRRNKRNQLRRRELVKYHVMGVLQGQRNRHEVATCATREEADVFVHNLLSSGAYQRAWVETEADDRTPLENEIQREIEQGLAE